MGEEGETTFGRRNFLELVSVFTSAPVLSVTDGHQELGMVDQQLFLTREPATDRVLSMSGRGWRVERVDWKERCVYVKPTEQLGKTVWLDAASGLSLSMGRAIRAILTTDDIPSCWSQRTIERMAQVRYTFAFLKPGRTVLAEFGDGSTCWFTFAGEAINLALAEALAMQGLISNRVDDYAVYCSTGWSREVFTSCLRNLDAAKVMPDHVFIIPEQHDLHPWTGSFA